MHRHQSRPMPNRIFQLASRTLGYMSTGINRVFIPFEIHLLQKLFIQKLSNFSPLHDTSSSFYLSDLTEKRIIRSHKKNEKNGHNFHSRPLKWKLCLDASELCSFIYQYDSRKHHSPSIPPIYPNHILVSISSLSLLPNHQILAAMSQL